MARGRTPRRGELAVKITVFGGSGFLGSHICDKLSEAGHAVTIVDLHPSPWLRPDQTMLTGNILDEETVRRGVEGADMVFNYAGIADIGEANNRPVDTARINVLGNVMILEACRRERVRRYVFASSLYVYGKSGGFYRCSKQACEIYIENYQAMHIQLFCQPYEAIHAECLGGQIDELSNKRCVIGCFPWKFTEGESCISRIVAFTGFDDV